MIGLRASALCNRTKDCYNPQHAEAGRSFIDPERWNAHFVALQRPSACSSLKLTDIDHSRIMLLSCGIVFPSMQLRQPMSHQSSTNQAIKLCIFVSVSYETQNVPIQPIIPSLVLVGRCDVAHVAFGSTYGFESEHRFTSLCISLQQAEITGEVLTGQFSSPTQLYSYPPGSRANRVAPSVPVVVLLS